MRQPRPERYRVRQSDQPEWVQAHRRVVGRRIQDARLHARLPQESLAEACGVDRRTIQNWEAGRADPPLGHLLLVAAALDVPLADLVG